MCNAWNHYAGCTCGWGEGNGGFDGITSWVPPIINTNESYINPNAFCPVCDASVFFYQSPNGGRVFFDELGPPWPKHPCTDGNSIPMQFTLQESLKHLKKREFYQWQRDGWVPLFIKLANRVDDSILKIFGTTNDKEIQLYIIYPRNNINSKTIAYVKKVSDLTYQLSFVTESVKHITVKASLRASELRNNLKSITKSIKQKNTYNNESKDVKSRADFLMNKKKYSQKPKNKVMANAFSKSHKNTDDS